ncbi:MAG: hypothetical protein ACKO2G_14030 [Verrucomicrobiales bacterium]
MTTIRRHPQAPLILLPQVRQAASFAPSAPLSERASKPWFFRFNPPGSITTASTVPTKPSTSEPQTTTTNSRPTHPQTPPEEQKHLSNFQGGATDTKSKNMDKMIKILTQEVTTVIMLGAVSVITAWAGVQSSLHGGESSKALSAYMEGLSESSNMHLTSELKYRTDMIVWADKQTTLSQGGDIFAGYSAGSFELFEFAIPCLIEKPESQLADCKTYMDSLYLPQQETFGQALESLEKSQVLNDYSDRLQMLTALLAVALFMLGITSVIHTQKLKFAIVLGAIAIALFSVFILFNVPIASIAW